MDMLTNTEGNSTVRNLYLAYSPRKEDQACMTFFEMMLEDHEHERKIALNGCKYLQVK
jgi:hypothetical protein